jgi:hypothetical protein
MEKFLMEGSNIKQVAVPSDMDTAVTGARIKMEKGDRLAIVLSMGDSVGAVVEFALKQHNAASGGTTKALEVMNPYFKKAGSATSFTKVEPTAVEDTYDLAADFAAQEGVVVFEVLGEDLDVNNGFAWVSVNAADSTVAKLLAGLYVVGKSRFQPAYEQAV